MARPKLADVRIKQRGRFKVCPICHKRRTLKNFKRHYEFCLNTREEKRHERA